MKNNKILFVLMGRYGDIILGSFIANMLIDNGYSITWLTIPYYKELVETVCERANIICAKVDTKSPWKTTHSKTIKNSYSDYHYYINSQIGSPEHHNNLIKSGVHSAWFMKSISENVLGIKLPNNFLSFAKLKKLKQINIKTDKPLVVIAPESLSSPSVISKQMVEYIYKKYKDKYYIKILTKGKYTFVECISLLQQVSFFFGNDSGLAWAALYNKNCKKIIYHNKDRIKKVNTYFHKLDPNAKDIIL